MNEKVACLSSSEYAERPIALYWQGERLEIEKVLARWRLPGSKCFRVSTVDGGVYELIYDENSDEWNVNQP